MTKVVQSPVASLTNESTALSTLNANSVAVQTGFENTLSRDGTSPNTMNANLDMNSNQIFNLPAPATAASPVRLQDVQAGGTITNIPAGGNTNDRLIKTSNADYVVGWGSEASDLVAGSNIAITGTSPATIATTATPTFTTVNTATIPTAVDTLVARNTTDTLTNKTLTAPVLTTPTLGVATATTLNKVTVTAPVSSATLTLIDGTVLTGPAATGTVMTLGNTETVTGVKTFGSAGAVGRFKVAGTTSGTTVVDATAVASGTLTLPAATDTLIGKATTDTLTNKTFNSTATGNVLQVSGVTVSSGQYPGEPTTGNATAGNVGEYVSSDIAIGSAVALTTATNANVTSISLTAGDWDVSFACQFTGGVTTTLSFTQGWLSTTSITPDTTLGRANSTFYNSATVFNFVNPSTPVSVRRFSLSSTTTIFAGARANFAVSTCSAFGTLSARRVR